MKRNKKLNESTLKLHKLLSERFGEPIGKQIATVGAADEGPGNKTTYDEDEKSGDWDDPDVFSE